MKITVIENNIEFSRLKALVREESAIAVPILADPRAHPCVNITTLVAIQPLSTKEFFVVPLFHYDSSFRAPFNELHFSTVYTPDKKLWLHQIDSQVDELYDLEAIDYLANTDETSVPIPTAARLLRRLRTNWSNAIAPLPKWADALAEYTSAIMAKGIARPTGYEWINDVALPILASVERNGLHVNLDAWEKHYPRHRKLVHENSRVFSSYNLYTAAGRPSCRHGGVNYGAIPKDYSRTAFTSRHDNGSMVLIDYESFHIRLIADMIDANLPSTDLHEHFSQTYYGGCHRDDSKAKTFAHLYGDTDTNIPFFNRVRTYRNGLWEQFEQQGYIEAPTGKNFTQGSISSATPSKLFNYVIQNKETRHNIDHLSTIQSLLEERNTCVVLYNYDSFLIDYDETEDWSIITDIVDLLEENGKFPVRIYKGESYGSVRQTDKQGKLVTIY